MTIPDVLRKWLELDLDLLKVRDIAYSGDGPVYPAKHNVFKAFTYFSPKDTKVVILAQDPYETPGKASGLAFGYHKDYKGPVNSSMLNIIKEVTGQPSVPKDFDLSLESWAEQGVLLINTRLTVAHEAPMSHAGIGWEPCIKNVLKYLKENTDCIFVCWGREAQLYIKELGVDNERTIQTSHPCRFSNNRTSRPFTGSDCFNRINAKLKEPVNFYVKSDSNI